MNNRLPLLARLKLARTLNAGVNLDAAGVEAAINLINRAVATSRQAHDLVIESQQQLTQAKLTLKRAKVRLIIAFAWLLASMAAFSTAIILAATL